MSRKIFTELEKNILINLVDKHKSIVELKKNDPSSIAKKQQKWKQIASEFNSEPNVEPRDDKKLKKAWENLKMKCKKDVSFLFSH